MKKIINCFIILMAFLLLGGASFVSAAQSNFLQQNSYPSNSSLQNSYTQGNLSNSMNNYSLRNNMNLRNMSNYSQSNNATQSINNQQNSNNDFKQISAIADEQKPSAIEELFDKDITLNDKNQPKLKQVGYDLLTNVNAQGFGKYDGSYVLSIGEKVDIYFWGDSVDMLSVSGSPLLTPLTKSQIDGKGNLFISGVGIIKAEGRTISSIEKDIQSLASQKYTNVKVRMTVSEATDFTVFVYGYVAKPGKVAVNNNSTVIEALAAAGGATKNGSLRNISYKSTGKSQNVDLYKTIFQGKESSVRLKPNDTIFVNKIGSVVAIKNGVKIPGLYEVNPSDSISDVIEYAGGFLPSTDKTISNIKAYNDKGGQRISMDIPGGLFKKTKLANGDIVEFRSLYGKAEDFITLEGNVKHPTVVGYKKGMRLSDVLKGKNELQDETLIHQAVIKRVAGDGKQVVSIPVSLEDFFHGGIDPALQPRDIITVYRSTNSDFIEVYGCIDRPKQLPYNDNLTLKDVMAGVQFVTSSSSESNVHNVSNNEVATKISSDNVIIPAYDIAVEISNENNLGNILTPYKPSDKKLNVKTIYLYDVLVQNDVIGDIYINPGDKILFRPLREDEIVKTIKISGYVNKPGVYGFVEGKRLTDAIQAAGGLSREADLRGVVFKRSSLITKGQEMVSDKVSKDVKQLQGQMANNPNVKEVAVQQDALDAISNEDTEKSAKSVGRISLNIKNNNINKIDDMNNIEIQDGDEIYIPKFSNHVMIIGEVYNETSFIYKKDAKASYYIRMVGGYTPNARRLRLYKIGVNGRATRLNLIATNKIEPGDTIVVPRRIKGNDWITPLAGTLQSIASLLTSVFVVTKL